eukprot:6286816-Pyramimonas_sp.AAC.1
MLRRCSGMHLAPKTGSHMTLSGRKKSNNDARRDLIGHGDRETSVNNGTIGSRHSLRFKSASFETHARIAPPSTSLT